MNGPHAQLCDIAAYAVKTAAIMLVDFGCV